jgi:hypothetical protein
MLVSFSTGERKWQEGLLVYIEEVRCWQVGVSVGEMGRRNGSFMIPDQTLGPSEREGP